MRYPRKVYALQHNKTGKIYVGSSANPDQRYWSHIWSLRNHKHANKQMQADYNKYGEDYSFYILDEINDISEKGKEFDWMLTLGTRNPEIGYNGRDPALINKRDVPPYKDGVPTPNEPGD